MSRFPRGVSGDPHRILRLRNNVERHLIHEGSVRRGRARPHGEGPVGGAVLDDHPLQHDHHLRPHHGSGNLHGCGGGCARLTADRHQRRLRWATRVNLIVIMPFVAAARRPGRLRWARQERAIRRPPHTFLPIQIPPPASRRAAGWFFWTRVMLTNAQAGTRSSNILQTVLVKPGSPGRIRFSIRRTWSLLSVPTARK